MIKTKIINNILLTIFGIPKFSSSKLLKYNYNILQQLLTMGVFCLDKNHSV